MPETRGSGSEIETRPLLFERLVRNVAPRPDLSFTPPPRELGPGIWSIERQVRFAGGVLPSRSTLIDVGSGDLVLISPPADLCEGIDRLGAIRALIAPNSFHHLYAERHVRRHPDAALFVAPGLVRRVPGLPRCAELTDDLDVAWRASLSYAVLGPQRGLSEVLFFHPRSRTLVLTDVACNLVALRGAYERFLALAAGMPRGFGPSRNARQLLLREPARAGAALRAAARWPFERIVVAHGEVIERDAQRAFSAAFARYL